MPPIRRSGFVSFGNNDIDFKECCPEKMSKVCGISLRREIQRKTSRYLSSSNGKYKSCSTSIIDVDTLQIDARIAHYKEKLDEKLSNIDELSEEKIHLIVNKYLRKIGGYLRSFDLLEDEEAAVEEEKYQTAFEETEDDGDEYDNK
uniref:Uncharacterized protein n=1 Tax=Panagrolaimus davidi TaxID=227884 RepID=A0A914QZB7_9BILA